MRAKRHHIIPKFYLSGFADENSRVVVCNLENGNSYQSNVSDVGIENNYFSLSSVEDEHVDAYERFMSLHEGQAAKALQMALTGTWPLPPVGREALATWIAYQHLRIRRRRVSYEQTQSQLIKLLVSSSSSESVRDWIENNEGKPISDAALAWELADLTKKSGPQIEIPPIQHIQLMEELLPVAKKRIEEGTWTLFYFERKSLVTSDTPVVLIPAENHPSWSGLGMLNAASWVITLGRRVAMQISFNDVAKDFAVPGSTALAKIINSVATNAARQFLYHHPEDVNLVEKVSRGVNKAEISSTSENFLGATSSPNYLPSDLPDLPSDSEDRSFGLHDLPWPIRGRKNARPDGL